jgi:predicted nucleic acid-binding protein
MMKKLKIYLDTSVISYLDQRDSPERMAETLAFWDSAVANKHNIAISDLTMIEVNNCFDPKRAFMQEKIAQIQYEEVFRNDETQRLSELYFERGGLPPKSRDDAQHIAIATVYDCNIILSWNFKHIVNLRAITAVEAVNIQEGYRTLRIMSPTMLLEEE